MVFREKEYQEALEIMNEFLPTLDGKKKITILILSELLFLAIHRMGETPIQVFKDACTQMAKNYQENSEMILEEKL